MSKSGKPKVVERDELSWRLGNSETVAWIQRNTPSGRAIISAIPPVFEHYATITEFCDDDAHDDVTVPEKRLVEILRQHGDLTWWLGYLDTGGSDVVFPGARKYKLYAGWPYIVVQAGPDQALRWRDSLPDLMFPVDHSWCLSTLWDDTWTCLGGSAALIGQLEVDPLIQFRRVGLEEDATPPGHDSI